MLAQQKRNWRKAYHITQVTPLVQEVPVDVNAVRLAQVLGNQGPDGGEVLALQGVLILDVLELGGKCYDSRRCIRRHFSPACRAVLGCKC